MLCSLTVLASLRWPLLLNMAAIKGHAQFPHQVRLPAICNLHKNSQTVKKGAAHAKNAA